MNKLASHWARGLLCTALAACCGVLISCRGEGRGGAEGEGTETPKTVMGFSQIGSESDWRAANTVSIKGEAKKRGVILRFADAQQKQENQIKALRTFVAQKVDIIAFSPVVETGWEPVLREIKQAGIPVILTDRGVDVTDPSLYVTFIGSDFVEEGRRAARWFIKNTTGDVRVFEMRGTPGASCAIDRKKGFEEAIKDHPRIKIIKSQDGNFERGKGKEVMEAFLKTREGKEFDALFAHNDDMALGAIQALKEAGIQPGKDIKIVSIDAVKAAFEAMIAGELNCSVECNPLLGPQLFDIVEAVLAAKRLDALAAKGDFLKPKVRELLGEMFLKRVLVKEEVFDQSVAKDVIGSRQY